jgi:hypothetical protein
MRISSYSSRKKRTLIALFISAIAVSLTILLYRKNIAMIPLRIAALIILALLISGFGMTIRFPRERTPLVLLDRSSSMARFLDQTEKVLGTIEFPHTVFAFSESLLAQDPSADTNPGTYTDITAALLAAAREHPSAILLVSDGNHNYGPSPLTVASELGTPVYCFGTGDDIRTDIAIADIIYPRYAYVGDSIPIDIIIASRGFAGGTGRVKITRGNSTLHQDFPLSEVLAKHTISVPFKVHDPGIHTFTVEIVPKPNEQTFDNNRAVFRVHALVEKIQVLYFTDHLSFNTRFILRTLHRDTHVELQAVTRISDGTYMNILTNRQRSIPALQEIDVLIMDNVDVKNLPWDTLDMHVQKGLGVVCMGELLGQHARFDQILPIATTGPGITGSFAIEIIQPFSCLAPGDDLAPFTRMNRVIAVKETAVVIAEAHDVPLIAYQRFGKGLVFQIIGVDIGKWQFVQTGLTKKNILSCLVTDAIRFVSPRGANTRLAMRTRTTEYSVGETIDVTMESYDRNFRKTGGGDFYLTYRQTRIPFYELQGGTYQASFTAATAGTLRLEASGTLRDEPLTSNVLTITVHHRPMEYEEGLNRELLKTLAEATGGTFQPLADMSLFQPPDAVYSTTRIHLDTPVSYVFIALLLAADWILRKRRGII